MVRRARKNQGEKGDFDETNENHGKSGYFLLIGRNLYFAVLMYSLVLLRYIEKMKYKICSEILNMCRTDNEYNSVFRVT